MADIKHIELPSGTTYNFVDEAGRALIEEMKGTLTGAMEYIGTTTTALSDGATTSPITIGTASITPKAGNVVIYGNKEFIWSDTDTAWHEFGSTGSLKALAFKDSASGSVKPSGSVSKPSFTGTAGTASASYTPKGSVSISKGTGTANYTPQGTCSAPSVSVSVNTTSVTPIASVGTLPSCTLPQLSATVSNETLVLSWTPGSFSAGTLPTKGNAVTVATGVKSATASAPTFTGTGADLEATFTGTQETINSSYTPAGSVSQPTFSGSESTVTVK